MSGSSTRHIVRGLRRAVNNVTRTKTLSNASLEAPWSAPAVRIAKHSRTFTASTSRRYPGLMPHSEDPEPPKNVESTQPRTAAPIDDEEYHLYADEFINKVNERAEEIAEQRNDVEVDYSAGVLTITMPPNGTYVINKQPPNKQIWLSSPITGPKRYDWSIAGESMDQKEGSGTGEWIYIRDGSGLSDLLRKELGIDATIGDLEKQLAQKSTDPVE